MTSYIIRSVRVEKYQSIRARSYELGAEEVADVANEDGVDERVVPPLRVVLLRMEDVLDDGAVLSTTDPMLLAMLLLAESLLGCTFLRDLMASDAQHGKNRARMSSLPVGHY